MPCVGLYMWNLNRSHIWMLIHIDIACLNSCLQRIGKYASEVSLSLFPIINNFHLDMCFKLYTLIVPDSFTLHMQAILMLSHWASEVYIWYVNTYPPSLSLFQPTIFGTVAKDTATDQSDQRVSLLNISTHNRSASARDFPQFVSIESVM